MNNAAVDYNQSLGKCYLQYNCYSNGPSFLKVASLEMNFSQVITLGNRSGALLGDIAWMIVKHFLANIFLGFNDLISK